MLESIGRKLKPLILKYVDEKKKERDMWFNECI
jgi:hypothetical protein